MRLLLSVLVGAALGFLCGTVLLVGSGLSLVPWSVAGIVVGALSTSRAEAVRNGAAYGFALAYVFMIAGYDGSAALHTRLAPFLVLGAVGAACGAALAVIGAAVGRGPRRSGARRLRPQRPHR
jgi:hypothetical protein